MAGTANAAEFVGGLIDTLRQNLALPAAFSPLDRVFGVSVRQRLSAFSGMGNGIFKDQLEPAQQSGMPPLLLGGMERDGVRR